VSRKGSKPDYIDIDGDGNKTEPMKQAAKGISRKEGMSKKEAKDLGRMVRTAQGTATKKDKRKNKRDTKKTIRHVKKHGSGYKSEGVSRKISEKAAERKAKKGKGYISQKTGGKDTEKSFTKLTRKGRKDMKETGMVSSKEMKKSRKIK